MQDLWRLSAADLANLVKTKKVSAREAAQSGLARLDAVNPAINAVVDHRPEDVLKQADAVDAAIARGEDPGVLAGVPVTIKVNVDQEGFATTNGLKLQRDLIANDQQPGGRQFAQGRRGLLGRTNCPAFSYRWFTTNLLHGDTKNPRDPSHDAGRLVRRCRRGGRGRHRPYRPRHRHRRLDPLSRLCLRRAWAAPDAGPHPRLQRGPAGAPDRAADHGGVGPAGAHRQRPQDRARGDVGPRHRAIPGGCRRRWKARACRSAPRCASIPDGLATAPEVKAAVADAGKRLERAGWTVEEIENTPPLREAADWQTKLWLGDGYEAQLDMPPSAKAIPARWPACAATAERCIRRCGRRSRRH